MPQPNDHNVVALCGHRVFAQGDTHTAAVQTKREAAYEALYKACGAKSERNPQYPSIQGVLSRALARTVPCTCC